MNSLNKEHMMPQQVNRRHFLQSIPMASAVLMRPNLWSSHGNAAENLTPLQSTAPTISSCERALRPEDFGVVGNGQNDDSEAFSKLLEIASKGGKTIFIKSGPLVGTKRGSAVLHIQGS